jgi:hypothetical protein
MAKESNPVWKFVCGVMIGVVLSWAYVRFGFTLPGILGWTGKVSSEAIVMTAEGTLYDPHATADVRKRALAVIVGQKPSLFLEIDAALDNRFYEEALRRKAVRKAQLIRSETSGYDVALSKPALRKVLETKHGATDDDSLKRRMLIARIRDDEFLNSYLTRRVPDLNSDQLVDTVLGIYQNELRMSGGQDFPAAKRVLTPSVSKLPELPPTNSALR